MKTLLDILIPTYNRMEYLERNIKLLLSFIEKLELKDKVNIIISNNASTDNTSKVLSVFNTDNLFLYKQEINIGLEKNAVFCLEKSKAQYVMFLGDDDFISIDYLGGVIKLIEDNYCCIVPSIIAIDIMGAKIGNGRVGRDLNRPTSFNPSGYEGALKLFEKGHQLSGITFLREGTLTSYINTDLRNIHPFMYFVGFNCLRGASVHFTEFPIQVTQPPQSKKDWDYGSDGLIIDRLKSTYGVFKENKKYLNKAQRIILYVDRGYAYKFLVSENGDFFNFLLKIIFSKYCSFQNKFYFLYLEFGFLVKKILKNALVK